MGTTEKITARLTADVVLFARRAGLAHVLLIERAREPFIGHWALPGGHVEEGERFADAAIRELGEETGITADSLIRVGFYDEPDRDPRGRVVSVAYTALLGTEPKPIAGDDAAAANWVPLLDALTGPLAFDHDQILRAAVALIVEKYRQNGSVQRAFGAGV
jgi:8-oxo-dGTP diphosphatase